MKNIATILAVIGLIATAALGYLYYDTNGQLTETTSQLNASRSAEAATSAKLDSANENIEALNKDLDSERTSLASTRSQLNDISTELAGQKRQNKNLTNQLTAANKKAKNLEDQNSSLGRKLTAMRRQVSELEDSRNRVVELEEQIVALQETNTEMQQTLMLSQAKLVSIGGPSELEEETSAAKYNFNDRPSVQPATLGPDVTIVTTRANDGMLVLQAPAEAGIEAGSEIVLVKDLKALAKIAIFESNDGELLANILPEPKPSALKDGSVVQFLR